MSKRDLNKYLKSLSKEQLEEQLLDLYGRFKEVKVYYNFVFNPKEDKLIEECKFKIAKEYFPTGKRKAKARRSIAQKHIKHFLQIGVDSSLIADVMLFNIETAQAFSAERPVIQDSFCKSMLNSFDQAVKFIADQGLYEANRSRIVKILETSEEQHWINAPAFERIVDRVEL